MGIKPDIASEHIELLSYEFTKNCVNDTEKTIAILNWFERNSATIFNVWG